MDKVEHIYVAETDTLRMVWKLKLDSGLVALKDYKRVAVLGALLAAVEDLIHAEIADDQ